MTEDRKNSQDSDVTTRTKSWQDDDGKNHTSMVSRQSASEPEFPNCDWHPIETAPKDGTEVDLWVIDTAGQAYRQVDVYWDVEGVWANYDGPLSDKFKATHWMLPPGPPKK